MFYTRISSQEIGYLRLFIDLLSEQQVNNSKILNNNEDTQKDYNSNNESVSAETHKKFE